MIEIEACPCCGGKSILKGGNNLPEYVPSVYYVECTECGCRGGTASYKTFAIQKWNKRVAKDAE